MLCCKAFSLDFQLPANAVSSDTKQRLLCISVNEQDKAVPPPLAPLPEDPVAVTNVFMVPMALRAHNLY
jgi:hypothetical protein